MGKFYVAVLIRGLKHKVCKDDIRKISSFKRRNIIAPPAYFPAEKEHDEEGTSCDDSQVEFEPMEFFPSGKAGTE